MRLFDNKVDYTLSYTAASFVPYYAQRLSAACILRGIWNMARRARSHGGHPRRAQDGPRRPPPGGLEALARPTRTHNGALAPDRETVMCPLGRLASAISVAGSKA